MLETHDLREGCALVPRRLKNKQTLQHFALSTYKRKIKVRDCCALAAQPGRKIALAANRLSSSRGGVQSIRDWRFSPLTILTILKDEESEL